MQRFPTGLKEIVIDFDGTIVKHEYPMVGPPVPNAIRVIQRMIDNGYKIILFTMRGGTRLDDAVKWCRANDIHLSGIQTNPDQNRWTNSPKAYGQLYIDDAAFGCPLIQAENSRDYVNWLVVEDQFERHNLFPYA